MIGEKIRFARKIRGLTLQQLGDVLGVTYQQVQKYEKGTNRTNADDLELIAEATGVNVSFFFDNYSVKPHDDNEMLLIKAYRNSKNKKKIIEIAEILK